MSAPTPSGVRVQELTTGWRIARSDPGACALPADTGTLSWSEARVPGTSAGAMPQARPDCDHDAHDWWFAVAFAAEPVAPGEEVTLALDGLATVADVYLNGVELLHSESMFAAHRLDVGGVLAAENELAVCCRALTPLLAVRRRPRARWRTRLVSAPNLRFYRTMLLGRAPGFAPGPPVVGPWRPVTLQRRRGAVADDVRIRARLRDGAGVVRVTARLRSTDGAAPPATIALVLRRAGAEHRTELEVAPDGAVAGELIVADPELWWPHTHGTPALYDLELGDPPLHRARVGFRELGSAADLRDGLDLRINGVPIFVRGAVWTPLAPLEPDVAQARLPEVLAATVASGLNMLRVVGTAAYESDRFHDLCDELGILVWQDFMFANLDYPEADPDFLDTVTSEAAAQLARLAHRPSLAVLCGGSEVAQQVAMLGLDPALAEGPLYGEVLPQAVRDAEIQAPYVPSAPWGGDLPFRPDRGVANYYGVGGYMRPLSDARLAGVRFASESLALANVPDDDALEQLATLGGAVVHDPAWKAGVPRDVGTGWDFDDVRDHYLRVLFDLDPGELRRVDPERYLALSRAVSGEVMAETFGEWRRDGSPCRGALVLWLTDLRPGAGWGLLDHRGAPKVALHHLRRALAPVAVWSTDEGLGGIAVHVANDRPVPLAARLRIALYRDREVCVETAEHQLELPAHGTLTDNVETLLGRFVDVSWAYRFGPPAQDLVVLSLERDVGDAGEVELLSQAFRFPAGRPTAVESAAALGLRGSLTRESERRARLTVFSDRFADGVRAQIPGWTASDDAFGVEPGHARAVALTWEGAGEPTPPAGSVTALNLSGRVAITVHDGG